MLTLLAPMAAVSARAQIDQFLPEIDLYHNLESWMRLEFQAKETREAGMPTQGEIGPSVSFLVKPILTLHSRIFDPDGARSHLFQLFVGYRYVGSPDKATIQRLTTGSTANLPLVGGFRVSDRTRFDLDWSPNLYRWRYRNRVEVQHRIKIGSYRPDPYAQAEFFYQSQYQKWSTTILTAGCIFPIHKRFSLDAYYQHQHITGGRKNQQLNQLGTTLNIR